MRSVNPLDPIQGPPIGLARVANGKWHVDGLPARLAAEIETDHDGNVVVTVIDPDTMVVVDTMKLDAA